MKLSQYLYQESKDLSVAEAKPKEEGDKANTPKGLRRREADLPGALAAVGDEEAHTHPKLSAEKCTPTGDKEDRALGCALALIRAGSQAKFLALFIGLVKQNRVN